jgi:type I restriction enzyme S subunit
LRVANVFDGFIDTEDVLEMPFLPAEKARFHLEVGDILLNEGQSLELVGRSAIYRGQPEDCCFQNTLVRFRSGADTRPEFAQYVFQHYLRCGVFASIALQTTSIAHLGSGRLASLKMPLPAPQEQAAIADALSDADALIESLEQLLAKKRHTKQGAMQELLTGKKRLPGFSGKWEVKQLEELADIRSGGTPSTTQPRFWDGDIPWCTPTDITALDGFKYLSDTNRRISDQGLKASSAEMIPANSIVMTSRATIGECAINRVPVSTNQGFKNFVPFENVDAEFLYYLLHMQKQGFISLCGGSTFLEIGKTQLVKYEVRLPSTKPEQTAIAAVLSDMDTEIATLETKLTKARQLKTGMMQELLTGRIRLI